MQIDITKAHGAKPLKTRRSRKHSTHKAGLFAAIENTPADDMLVGRLIAEMGYQVELLPYAVRAGDDFFAYQLCAKSRSVARRRVCNPQRHTRFRRRIGSKRERRKPYPLNVLKEFTRRGVKFMLA